MLIMQAAWINKNNTCSVPHGLQMLSKEKDCQQMAMVSQGNMMHKVIKIADTCID